MREKGTDWQQYGVIGVAVSGGVDSMCLLHFLVHAGAQVTGLTVEHGIRGEASLADADLVEAYCRALGVACRVRHVDAPAYAERYHVGLEEAARTLRHAFFTDTLREGVVDTIATAHHADDRAEGVLLNVLRGSGLRGLGGVGARPRYVCPFLQWTRAEIEAYARRYDVPYREDVTNADTAYNRNYLRHTVLPLVEARWPQYRRSMARLSDACREQVDLLNTLAIPPTVEGDVVVLPLAALSQHVALAKWSIGLAVRHFDHGLDVDHEGYARVMALANSRSNAVVPLAHDLRAAKEYDRVAFWRQPSLEDVVYPFAEGRFPFGGHVYRVRPYREGDLLRFDADRVPAGAVVRLRRAHDVIAKFGGGTKSLGDYYTDKKVPLRVRDAYPVVAVDSQVLVCCVDPARTVAITEDTQRIYTFVQEDEG